MSKQEEHHGNKCRNIKNSDLDSLMLTAFLAKKDLFSLLGIEIPAIHVMQLTWDSLPSSDAVWTGGSNWSALHIFSPPWLLEGIQLD